MPRMVYSCVPKTNTNDGVLRNRRTKIRPNAEKFVTINYMYVGEPKKTQTLYVREKVMSQEVTFTELHNYLMRVCGNDYTITLHYTLNNQYVSITTTGQLQTFLEYVRQIPTMLLYVENKDYVWNLDGKSKSGKKKHCNGATQEARSSTSSSENSEESSETGSSEADVEVNVDECRQCICCKCALDSPNDDAEVPAEGATLEGDSSCDECFSPTHSESDSLEHIKADMLEDDDEYLSLSDNEADAASQCSIGSGNKTFDYSSLSSNESYATYKLFKKPVKTNKELLKEKSASELRVMCDCLDSCRQCYSNNKIWVKFKEIIQEKLENQYYNIIKEDFLIKNECDPDMIEDGMYTFLNKLAQDTITQLWEIHSKHAPTTPVPKKEDPQPSEGAKLKIKSGPVETTHEECPNDACRSYNDVIDVIYFYAKKIRAMNLIVKRKPLWRSFVDDMKKLRDLDVGTLLPESNLSDLRGLIETSVKTVEKLCVVLETDWKEETELCHCDTNFIVKATKLMNTLSASPFDSSGDSEWSSAECSKWKKNVRQSIDALQNS